MKGMQEIRGEKGFTGAVLYTLRLCPHHKKGPIVIGGSIMIVSNVTRGLIVEFDSARQLRPDVQKAAWHSSLCLPKNGASRNSAWAIIADDYVTRTGFSEVHLRCYILHDDEDDQHIHIIANRVSLNAGKLYLGEGENLVSTRIIEKLEQGYQLTRTKGSGALKPYASPVKRKKSHNGVMLEERASKPCPKSIVQRAIGSITLNPIAVDDFIKKLNNMGIATKSNITSTGKTNGFPSECKGVAFKASQFDKKYSWKNLEPMISMDSNSNIREERPVIPVPDASRSNEAVISIMEDYPDEEIRSEIGLSLIRPDIASTKPTGTAIRWIASISYLVNVISTPKTIHTPFLKVFNDPTRLFSMSMIHLSLRSLEQTKTDSLEPRSPHHRVHKPLLP